MKGTTSIETKPDNNIFSRWRFHWRYNYKLKKLDLHSTL